METFWLTAFTNIWGPYYASKSVNCPPAPTWTEGSATSPSPRVSDPPLYLGRVSASLTRGLGKKAHGEGLCRGIPIPPLVSTDTQYCHRQTILQSQSSSEVFAIPAASHHPCQNWKAPYRWPQLSPEPWRAAVQDPKALSLQGWAWVPFNGTCLHPRWGCLFCIASISHIISATLSSCEGMIWDLAIFQQEDEKTHIVISARASHQSRLAG